MILYFSGTGNSRFVAKHLGHFLSDEVISINDLLKSKQSQTFRSEKPFVFVVPSYMSRMPLKVEEFLMNCHFQGHRHAYFILTAGQAIGNADQYCQKICQHHHLNYCGTQGIQMPANYVVMYDVLDKSEASQKAQEVLPVIENIGRMIQNNETLINDQLRGNKLFSYFAVPFNKLMVGSKKFHVEEGCIGCGQCTHVCPLNNIQLVDGKPVWKQDCMHCMACISVCPKRVIQYGNQTKKRNRYYLEG